jgi:hypothetical protein
MHHVYRPQCRQTASIILPRGVIKVKGGYNPNSSSIGTVVYSFPLAIPIVSVVLAAVAALLRGRRHVDTDSSRDDA